MNACQSSQSNGPAISVYTEFGEFLEATRYYLSKTRKCRVEWAELGFSRQSHFAWRRTKGEFIKIRAKTLFKICIALNCRSELLPFVPDKSVEQLNGWIARHHAGWRPSGDCLVPPELLKTTTDVESACGHWPAKLDSQTMAIVPFSDGSKESDQECLCAVLTEAIRFAVRNHVTVVETRSSSQLRDKVDDPCEIGKQLNVSLF